jgi:uncharacterized protein YfaT (DUF1175 family)
MCELGEIPPTFVGTSPDSYSTLSGELNCFFKAESPHLMCELGEIPPTFVGTSPDSYSTLSGELNCFFKAESPHLMCELGEIRTLNQFLKRELLYR